MKKQEYYMTESRIGKGGVYFMYLVQLVIPFRIPPNPAMLVNGIEKALLPWA